MKLDRPHFLCRTVIQDNTLQIGTVLYRCIAELALSLRASKITWQAATTSVQLRILEGSALLFRFALFGFVNVEVFPPHPFPLHVDALRVAHRKPQYPVRTFNDVDALYDFLYSHWFSGIITSRLPPTNDYRTPAVRPAQPAHNIPIGSAAVGIGQPKKSWCEARKLDVTATCNRLRQEVELMISGQTSDKVRLKRVPKKNNDDVSSSINPFIH